MTRPPSPSRADLVDELLERARRLIRSPDLDNWGRRFLASALGAAKRARAAGRVWQPSDRQLAALERTVAEQDGPEVIERDPPLLEKNGGRQHAPLPLHPENRNGR